VCTQFLRSKTVADRVFCDFCLSTWLLLIDGLKPYLVFVSSPLALLVSKLDSCKESERKDRSSLLCTLL